MKTLKVLLQEVVSGIKAWVNSNFAQESNTVHKTGNETVNGSKTFSDGIYSSNYYYNGTAWGLDKENIWTGINTFSTASYGEMIRLKNTSLDLSNGNPALSSAANHMIWWDDKNNTPYAKVQAWTNDNSSAIVLASYFRTDANTVGYSSVRNQCSDSFRAFFPDSDGDTDLGTSDFKWKTFNGVNPGALSLPDFSAEYNVSGEIVPPEGENVININGGSNYFTPTVSGWLSIRMHFATAIKICRSTRSSYAFESKNSSEGDLCVCSPVVAGVTYKIIIQASKWDVSGNNYDHFRLAPCLGNV